MTKVKVRATGAEIDAALARARTAGKETVAESVRYVPSHDFYIVHLTNGKRLLLPREELQGLENATRALMKGVFGTRHWMSELGRAAGSVESEAKAQAARLNGTKGGRPRKMAVHGKRNAQKPHSAPYSDAPRS